MVVRVYVEGGGDSGNLRAKCRQGFSEFFKKSGLLNKMPRVIACGGRSQAFNRFCHALLQYTETFCILLVDSEGPIKNNTEKAWAYVAQRQGDEWKKPVGASEENIHLMVQCMEAWFMADLSCLKKYFGDDFRENTIPSRNEIEEVSKNEILTALKNATKSCRKGVYSKGDHSFELLRRLDPEKVIERSPFAKKLIDTLATKADS